MTKAEAKRYVAGCVATLLDPRAGHGNAFINYPNGDEGGDPYPDADRKRLRDALCDLVDELERRAGRDRG